MSVWLKRAAVLAALGAAACGGGGGGSPAGPPSVPAGLAAAATSASTVSLSWTASPGASGYVLYRDGTQIATPAAATYADSALAAATTYQYAVAASGTGGTSAASAGVSVTTPTDAPQGLTATATWNTVALSWNAVSGATGYLAYRNGTSLGGAVSATSYTDTTVAGGTGYSYTIVAVSKGGDSAPGTPLAVTTPATPPVSPPAPAGLTATATSNSTVSLVWSAVGPTQTGAVSYRVYRNGGLPALGPVTTAGYTDSGLAQGAQYSYTVQAFDSAGHSSPQSAAALVTTQGPTTPTGLTASATSNTAIALSWTAATDTLPLAGYRIYRDGTALPVSVPTAAYTDTVPQASTHTYTVAAFDASYASAPSTGTSATTPGPSAPVLSITATAASSVALSWSAVSDSLGVAGYRVYRRASSAQGTGALVTSTAATTYTDTGFPQTGSYVYTVVAYDSQNYTATSNAATSGAITTATPIVVAPAQVALTTQQTQQYTATVGGQPVAGAVTWAVDGVAGGNATVGTISAGGLYAPPAAPAAGSMHTVSASTAANTTAQAATLTFTDLAGIYSYHADNARTGQNLHEYALTSAVLRGGGFGRLYSCPLDGDVYAQPVYVANVAIGGGHHNVVYVVTMNDSVYAFDADNGSCTPYWKQAYAGAGEIPIPVADTNPSPGQCGDVNTEYGITGTPVVDPSSNTIYFVTATKAPATTSYYQRLHALDIATGAERTSSPATIAASVSGAGPVNPITFDPLWQNQRAGLALTGGQVYVSWASHCDLNNWWGWVIAYNAATLSQTAVFNDAPNGINGGIWMSGAAPAIDTTGNLYLTTGNGTFDYTSAIVPPLAPPMNDYGESYLKLALTTTGGPSSITVADFYTPSMNATWSADDYDLSSSGVIVLPDGAGPAAHPNVVAGSDKQGHLWLLDRSAPAATPGTSMGGFSPGGENVVQYTNLPGYSNCPAGTIDSSPSYWNHTLYIAMNTGPIMAVPLNSGVIPTTGSGSPPNLVPAAQSTELYGFPAPTVMISAAGTSSSAIVWALDNNANGTDNCNGALGPAILRAYDATTMATLYDSSANAGDAAGNAIKFQVPVVANGHVYVAGSGQLTVYGLKP